MSFMLIKSWVVVSVAYYVLFSLNSYLHMVFWLCICINYFFSEPKFLAINGLSYLLSFGILSKVEQDSSTCFRNIVLK